MSGTHHQLLYHFVFSRKNRKPYLQPETRSKMFEYLGGTVNGLDGIPFCIGGWVDHVHLLLKLKTSHRISDFMRELKAGSSKHFNDTSGSVFKFGWQDGYGAFTVSSSKQEDVTRYIQTQEAHHGKQTFEQEYVELLTRHEVAFDLKYLWD